MKHQEHLRDSAPCSSRWDGFCRGDVSQEPDHGSRVIGRMTTHYGVVSIVHYWHGMDDAFEVMVNGNRVHSTDDVTQATTVARWWVAGCPA